MTEQEEIREGMVNFFTPPERIEHGGEDYFDDNIGQVVDKLLDYLHSRGVVIKVDRVLPKDELAEMVIRQTEVIGLPEARHPYYQAQQDMLKAGYVAVEPLISPQVEI